MSHSEHEAHEQTHRDDLARAVRATPKPKGDRMTKIRSVVDARQCARIEGKFVDLTTAHMLVQVHDALSQDNQKKFAAMPLAKMVDVGWKLCK